MYPLLKICNHPLATNRTEYERRYCAAHANRWSKWDVSGAAYLDELSAKVSDIMVRRTKKEVLTELPDKTRILQSAEVPTESAKVYNAVMAQLKKEYADKNNAGTLQPGDPLVLLNHLRHAASMAKVDQAVALADDILG